MNGGVLKTSSTLSVSCTTMRYLTSIPRTPIPKGKIVVHNHVRPTALLGGNGFRAWTDVPDAKYERCRCQWAAGILKEHYRVRR